MDNLAVDYIAGQEEEVIENYKHNAYFLAKDLLGFFRPIRCRANSRKSLGHQHGLLG